MGFVQPLETGFALWKANIDNAHASGRALSNHVASHKCDERCPAYRELKRKQEKHAKDASKVR